MQAQLGRDLRQCGSSRTVPLYAFISKLVFQASVASLFSPEAADDPDLYTAFQTFDQHLPMAAAGFKVNITEARKLQRLLFPVLTWVSVACRSTMWRPPRAPAPCC
jgi:hypothetical protein